MIALTTEMKFFNLLFCSGLNNKAPNLVSSFLHQSHLGLIAINFFVPEEAPLSEVRFPSKWWAGRESNPQDLTVTPPRRGALCVNGARGGTRTLNPLRETDFKSVAYTNSATRAPFTQDKYNSATRPPFGWKNTSSVTWAWLIKEINYTFNQKPNRHWTKPNN